MRILLVEDSADHRELMSLALTGHDPTWQVEEVASGKEALRRLAEEEAYDLVFLDYSLPGRDGLEVLEEIRRDEGLPPVVMVTGLGDEQVAVEAMKGGAYDYVVKGKGYLQRLPVVAQRAVEAQQLAVERKRAAEALRESEERLRSFMDSATESFTLWDSELNLIRTNEAGLKYYAPGTRKEDVVGKSMLDLVPDIKETGRYDQYLKVIKTGEPLLIDYVVPQPIFGDVCVTVRAFKVGNGLGMIVADVTERKRAEEELQRLYEQAQRDAEIKATLLDEVNHRVKNNLLAIVGLLYAERRYAETTDQAAYRAITRNLMNRVGGLTTVHSLLAASQWAPLLLSDLAGQVVHSSLQMLPRHKGVSVEVTPSPVRVTADQAHSLALVINELATNTVKHALQERDTAHIAVRIALEDEDDTVRFEFRDDGPGYPEDVLQLERYRVGFDLIQNMVRMGLRGELSLHNDGGAVAVIRFKAQA